MTRLTLTGRPLHPAIGPLRHKLETGRVSRREFLALATSFGLTSQAALTMAGPAQAAEPEVEIAPEATLKCQMRILDVDDPRLFDWSEKGNIARGLCENLVRWRRDLTLEPWLLRAWEVNDDATTYRLFLRENVSWSNGDPLTASDVAYNFARWCDGTVAGNSMASRFSALTDAATQQLATGAVEVLDDLTIQLNLSRSDVAVIANLSDYPALMVHRDFDAKGSSLMAHPVGTGPYEITDLQVGSHATLQRRAGWWGGQPALERIEYVDLGTDPASFVRAFQDGTIDMVHETSATYIDVFDEMALKKSQIDTSSTLVCRGNQRFEQDGHRPFSDPRVRRALSLAVDNSIVLELGYGNRGTPAQNTHVSPEQPEYSPVPDPVRDPAKARALMTDAGLSEMPLTLVTLDDDWNALSGDALAVQMRDAGLLVERQRMHGSSFWANWKEHGLSCTQWNARPLAVQVLNLAYTSYGAWNECGIANQALDALIETATSQVDTESRRKTVAEIQKILLEEAAIIQPYWRTLYRHMRRNVMGADKHPAHEHHHDLWFKTAER